MGPLDAHGTSGNAQKQGNGGGGGPHTYIVFVTFIGNIFSIPLILPLIALALG
jgi:hypothetical protein